MQEEPRVCTFYLAQERVSKALGPDAGLEQGWPDGVPSCPELGAGRARLQMTALNPKPLQPGRVSWASRSARWRCGPWAGRGAPSSAGGRQAVRGQGVVCRVSSHDLTI